MDVVNMAISSVVQVVIFSIIPVVWWAVMARKTYTFWRWFGLVWPKLQCTHLWLVMAARHGFSVDNAARAALFGVM